MDPIDTIARIIAFTGLLFSFVALFFAWRANLRADFSRLRRLEKLVGNLEADNVVMTDNHARLYKAMDRIRKRLNADSGRRKRQEEAANDEPDPEQDYSAWRQWVRVNFPNGALPRRN